MSVKPQKSVILKIAVYKSRGCSILCNGITEYCIYNMKTSVATLIWYSVTFLQKDVIKADRHVKISG